MDEYVMKQKIQKAFFEPRAPEALIQQVILRAQAVTMGAQAQNRLEAEPGQDVGRLASRVLVGQLAAVSELPQGTQPEQLARQLEQAPQFQGALRGGNVAARLRSGELLQQVTGTAAQPEQKTGAPEKDAPRLPGMG